MRKEKSRFGNKLIANIETTNFSKTKIYTFIRRHLGHEHDRIAVGTLKTAIMNFAVILFKIGMSIYYNSLWFAINSAFYLVISLAYAQALRKYVEARKIASVKERYYKEFEFYEKSGVFVVLLGATYFIACLWMYMKGNAVTYNGEILNITVTFIAFCKITTAIIGVVKYRHMKNPLISSIKIMGLIDAVVSIVVAQCTLINMSGDHFSAVESSSLFGMACSAGFIVTGIVMLCKKNKYQFINGGDGFGED